MENKPRKELEKAFYPFPALRQDFLDLAKSLQRCA